jgi:hypothetical protein
MQAILRNLLRSGSLAHAAKKHQDECAERAYLSRHLKCLEISLWYPHPKFRAWTAP